MNRIPLIREYSAAERTGLRNQAARSLNASSCRSLLGSVAASTTDRPTCARSNASETMLFSRASPHWAQFPPTELSKLTSKSSLMVLRRAWTRMLLLTAVAISTIGKVARENNMIQSKDVHYRYLVKSSGPRYLCNTLPTSCILAYCQYRPCPRRETRRSYAISS